MPKIILTAENFAFGPISKLLFIANKLKDKKYHLVFVGFGTSLQLAKKFPFDEIYELDTDKSENSSKLKEIISQGDLLISSMDLSSVVLAKASNIPIVWLDCLFWFWKEIPQPVFDVDAYIRELTIEDSSNEIKYKDRIKNLVTVGPIIGESNNHISKRNTALISFGGGEASYWYKVGKDTNYPFTMAEILSKYVDWSGFEEVTLSTNEKVIDALKEKYPKAPFRFKSLSQSEFLKQLSSAKVLLTTAGLVTTESAFQQQTPTIFLPSSNNSHHLLLDELRKLNLAPASIQLDDFMTAIKIKGIDPHESMKTVMEQLRVFEKSEDIRGKVGKRINRLVQDIDNWAPTSVVEASNYINSLGGNGTPTVIGIIEDILSRKNVRE